MSFGVYHYELIKNIIWFHKPNLLTLSSYTLLYWVFCWSQCSKYCLNITRIGNITMLSLFIIYTQLYGNVI